MDYGAWVKKGRKEGRKEGRKDVGTLDCGAKVLLSIKV